MQIFQQFPAGVDWSTHRQAATYTDTEDPENDRIIRVWDVEPIPPEELKAAGTAKCVEAVRTYLDQTANGFGYDSMLSAVTYAADPTNPTWQAEGVALRGWRSAAWTAAYAYTGAADIPDPDECLTKLPTLASIAGAEAYRAMILRRADALAATDPAAALALRQSVS